MKRFATRWLGAALAAAALLPMAAMAQTLTKIRVSTIPIIDTAPLYAAIAQGYFKDAGLELDLTPSVGGAVGLPALATGDVQVAISNSVSIILGAHQGLGFKIISAGSFTGAKPPDIAAIAVPPDSTVKSGKDLEGKRLAVNTRANVIWLYANAWVEATGGNPKAVTYLEVPFPQMLDALRSKRVDAAFLIDPFLTAGLEQHAVKVIGWPYNKLQPRIPIAMYAATESYIKAHPEVIAAFDKAYDRGVDWVNQHAGDQEWIKLVASYTHLPPKRIADLHVPPFEKTIDPARLQPTIELMVKYGLLDKSIPAASVLAPSATAK
jgi:NitT/TauT family transport system substrate-binding protein